MKGSLCLLIQSNDISVDMVSVLTCEIENALKVQCDDIIT